MPTVLRVGPYRFFFFAGDRSEPPHIHVRRDKNEAKYWLSPVRLARKVGFKPAELRKIKRTVEEHEQQLVKAWNEEFKR